MSDQQGRQSPPPESQSGKQLKDTPGSGQGISSDASKNEQKNKDAISHLTSNPKGPMEDALEEKFAKTAK